MNLENIIKVFEKTARENYWGDTAYITIYSDGSGRVSDSDDDCLFTFDDTNELIELLSDY